MRKLYFAVFHLGVDGRWTPPTGEVIDFLGEWIFAGHRAFRDSTGFPDAYREPGRHPLGEDAALDVVRRDMDATSSFGVRLLRTHGRRPAHSRIIEVVLGERRDARALRVAVSAYTARREGVLRPERTRPRAPRIVKELVRRFGAYDDREISIEPRSVERADADDIARVLTATERTLPVVLCSPRNRDDRPVTSPRRLAEALVGLAHVYLLADRFVTLRLRDRLGASLACYDGAVRVYWPGSVSEERAREHRYWTPEAVGSRGRRFPETVLRYLRPAAIARVPEPSLDWHVLEASARRAKEERRERRDEAAERLERRIADLSARLDEERERARSWEDAYTQLWAEVEREGVELAHLPPHERPGSVEEAVRWALERYPDRLDLALNSRSSLEGNPFEDPEAVRRALACLATTYADARRGTISEPNLDEAFLAASGFRYSPHQSSTTMGRFPNHYRTVWRDRTVPLEEHLKKGTSRDPRHTIRIAFFYDEECGRVVIGYIGLHQRNTVS